MSFRQHFVIPTLLVAVLSLSSCFSSKNEVYEGLTYPPTTAIKFTFQKTVVPKTCKVFSHAILTTPAGSTMEDIKNALTEDAKQKGADLIFLGLARTVDTGDDIDIFAFTSYGPVASYLFSQNWQHWEYGFSEWQSGDEFVNFGYDKYKNPEISYDHSLMIKHVLLRCQTE